MAAPDQDSAVTALFASLPRSIPLEVHSSPDDKALKTRIAALELHPSFEALLHLLNADLPAAHFLARHMQSPPAVEGMLLHSILHRVEGDFENARLWMKDVGRDWVAGNSKDSDKGRGGRLLCFVYGDESDVKEASTRGVSEGDRDASVDRAIAMIDQAETQRKGDKNGGASLIEGCENELSRLKAWCMFVFGTQRMVDATQAYAGPTEEVQKLGQEMVSGDKGFRSF